MELGIISLLLIAGVIGVIAGMRIERSKTRKVETQGVIYVYCGDHENKPSLLLEYAVPIDDIISRNRVIFDVNIVK